MHHHASHNICNASPCDFDPCDFEIENTRRSTLHVLQRDMQLSDAQGEGEMQLLSEIRNSEMIMQQQKK